MIEEQCPDEWESEDRMPMKDEDELSHFNLEDIKCNLITKPDIINFIIKNKTR